MAIVDARAFELAHELNRLKEQALELEVIEKELGWAKELLAKVLLLHSPREGWEREWVDPDEAFALGYPICAGCVLPGIGQRTIGQCPTRKIFDDFMDSEEEDDD